MWSVNNVAGGDSPESAKQGSMDGELFLADSEGFQQSVLFLAAEVRGRINQPNAKKFKRT